MAPDNNFQKIDSDHYELIFPETFSKKAKSIASMLDQSYDHINKSLGVPNDYKLSIIFNNQTAFSNGFVTLAPFYSMFYSLPPQANTYSLFYNDWIKLLASHELRHAAQFNKLNHGFNRVLSFLFGDIGLAAGIGLSAPGWFMEGDAVYTETAVTNFGRGKIASFSMLTRAMLLNDEIPDYSQAYLNSNYAVYPNIYELGYLLNARLRNQHGDDIFDKILSFSSSWDVLTGPYSFALGVHSKTGKSLFKNYDELMSFLQAGWKKQMDGVHLTDYTTIPKKDRSFYTEYKSPVIPSAEKNLYAYKTGKFNAGAIIKISSGKPEQVIAFTGYLTGNLNAGKNTLIWSEEEPDIRWDKSTSAIFVYNTASRNVKKIRLNGRLFAPSVSIDDKNIACIEYEITGDSYLVILDAIKSSIIEKIKVPDGSLWQTPRWGNSLDKIAILESTTSGKAIIIYDLNQKKIIRNMKPLRHQISDPYIFNDNILFNLDISGIDNIHALNINTGELKQVTSVLLGAFQPFVTPDGKYLYYSNFTRMGHEIAQMKYDPTRWSNEEPEVPATPFKNTDPSRSDYNTGILDNAPEKNFPVSPYSGLANFLNFHSRYIGPQIDFFNRSIVSVDNIEAAFISSNKLQTHFVTLFYTYNMKKSSNRAAAQWTYLGWFPQFNFGGIVDFPYSYYADLSNTVTVPAKKTAYMDISLPVTVSRGPLSQTIEPGIDTGYNVLNNTAEFSSALSFRYDFSLKGNPRLFDYPYFKWGINSKYYPQISLFNGSGWLTGAGAYIQVPGFFNNNKITLRFSGYRQNNINNLFISPDNAMRAEDFNLHNELYLISLDYFLPLFYPDFNIFHIVYLRQISLNFFYERVWTKPDTFTDPQYGGADFLVTLNLFDLPVPVTGGVRCIYFPVGRRVKIEPLASVSVNLLF